MNLRPLEVALSSIKWPSFRQDDASRERERDRFHKSFVVAASFCEIIIVEGTAPTRRKNEDGPRVRHSPITGPIRGRKRSSCQIKSQVVRNLYFFFKYIVTFYYFVIF